MSANWPFIELGELVNEITVGFVGSMTHEYVDEGVPFFRSKNISEYEIEWNDIRYISQDFHRKLKKSVLRPGDVAIVRTGKPGTACVIPDSVDEANCSDIVIVRVNDDKLSAHYLSYFMNSIASHQVSSHLVGAVQQHFNVGSAKKIKIPLPTRDEQEEIVKILKSLDDKRKLNNQINQTLESIAQAIFKSWFVDFEPVKAKIAAIEAGEDAEGVTRAATRTISGKTEDELDQMQAGQLEDYAQLKTTAELFPSSMQDSELGEVPEGWEVSNFGEVSTCFDKNRIPLSKRQREQKHGLIPYYGATSIMDYVDEYIFDGIYLLVGEDGSVLKDNGSPFIQYIWGKSWVNNHAHVLQGANGVSTEHLMLFMQSQNITAYVTGAVQLKLNQKNMNSIPFINAGNPINDAFKVSIAPLYEFKRNAEEEIEELSNLRDTLLPKLLSGELEINTTIKTEN